MHTLAYALTRLCKSVPQIPPEVTVFGQPLSDRLNVAKGHIPPIILGQPQRPRHVL